MSTFSRLTENAPPVSFQMEKTVEIVLRLCVEGGKNLVRRPEVWLEGQSLSRLCVGKTFVSAPRTSLVHMVPQHTYITATAAATTSQANDHESQAGLGILGRPHAFSSLGDFQPYFESAQVGRSFHGLPESLTSDGS